MGKGTFGSVFKANHKETGEVVAIKRLDLTSYSKELEILKMIKHPNCIELRDHYKNVWEGKPKLYIVMDFVPMTLYDQIKYMRIIEKVMPNLMLKLLSYQLLRSVAYIHSKGICHRDIKPQNILLNGKTKVLKLCDFGNSKQLVRGLPNHPIVGTRYYRAPEQILGNEYYGTKVDVWAVGCVIAEMMLGKPIFRGETEGSQLEAIMKVLGTPSRNDVNAMNPHYRNSLPKFEPKPWREVFNNSISDEAINFVDQLL